MKRSTLALSTAAAVLALLAGSSAYSAWQLNRQLDHIDQALADYPLLKTVSRNKSYSLWESQETVSYQLGCESQFGDEMFNGTRPAITVRHTVSHNPFSPGVRTEIVWPAAWAEQIKTLFGDRPPLSIDTRASWLGELETHISSPGFRLEKEGNTVHWKGLDARLQYDKALQHLNSQLSVYGTEASDSQGRFKLQLQDTTYQGQHQRSASGLLLGQESIRFGGLLLSGNQGETQHSFSAGVLDSSAQSTEQDGMVAISAKGSWVGLHYNNKPLGDMSGQGSLSRLDAKALADYHKQSMVNGILQCNFHNDLSNPANRALLVRILSRSPALTQLLTLANPEGNSTLDIKASLVAPSEAELTDNGAALANKLALQAQISWPQSLPERWINDFAPETQRDMLVRGYRDTVAQMLASGSLQQAGPLLRTRFDMTQGKLLQNGKPFQPPHAAAPAAEPASAPAADTALPAPPAEAPAQ
jgi:uncharacterized protein YdgA (DUF945 family)